MIGVTSNVILLPDKVFTNICICDDERMVFVDDDVTEEDGNNFVGVDDSEVRYSGCIIFFAYNFGGFFFLL